MINFYQQLDPIQAKSSKNKTLKKIKTSPLNSSVTKTFTCYKILTWPVVPCFTVAIKVPRISEGNEGPSEPADP